MSTATVAQAAQAVGTIADMTPGDIGFTVPWAMRRDKDGKLWMIGKFRVYFEPNPADDSVMLIEYHGNGWHVWPPEGQPYEKHAMPPRLVKFPVANVHDAPAGARRGRR